MPAASCVDLPVADAAAKALADDDPDAARNFLAQGVIEATATDNRVTVLRILNDRPGAAVSAKAQAVLDDGSALALHRFLMIDLLEAVKEDDRVTVLRLLNSAGPYMQSAAQIVMEGSARMRRNFVVHDQYAITQLDQDRAGHIAAVRAALAHAARVAALAMQDAALASKAAAEARNAASEASNWAAKAKGYATDAEKSAKEARANADAADKSAAQAAQSGRPPAGTASHGEACGASVEEADCSVPGFVGGRHSSCGLPHRLTMADPLG
ncbi:ALF repeat-containing protein [Streptomyces sp. NPDC096198]|uniref:ALF repeat-containing protein n=1 Tax=Streptomyces sp. NPDC096198 TaxID=3366080 RepID=UPI00381699D1